MNAGIVQVVCIVFLIVLFGLVFKRYPLEMTIRNLVLASLFVLISVILNAISIMIPFFGVPSVKITFALLPLMISGAVLSPSWAYLVGFVTDLVGLLITPTGFPFFGFTLNHVLVATLPAIWYQRSVKLKPKIIQRLINISFVSLAVLASLYILSINQVSIEKKVIEITLLIKISLITFIFLFVIVMFIILHYVRKRLSEEAAEELAKWMVVALSMELLISLMLTPFWLDVMYGIPWFISTFIRVVKACVMIPINITVGYSLVKIVKRISFS
ncbi:ECF transporter S component (folate family) [Breznakia sp. PF5-3]|uniref:folate family ECF transporter S component n=1 Tax=unclassified Breznakia TaxID=2623764 RepID=UPI002405825E|nr:MULTISPECIES: folate family ECF transporter S component [unclassified Breznakia]MDF9824573.1 ECF transporter S component (folate family) [Breznakia sp. PM6-1]MDF9835463.1 ECF transporter S component (folate family) [Breznakia sp. PF5-3]MDF9837873.1 ECF transporter S component (folate family) [Breznakia sp. PFB2-8]MDF9859834.1 ECF transporter S component (folate family) [Breznakia sp. PH5-24]